jgi:hypothetical protein
VAETITASGDAVENAQTLTDPGERLARDAALRATFADPTSRHHEAIAEAELDVDYGRSPIVMGDAQGALAAGQRLPDTIEVLLAGGATCGLHELTHRAGHTALLIGGAAARGDELARLAGSMHSSCDTSLIEATFVLTSRSDAAVLPYKRLAPDAASELGIVAVTLLVVRPDGHVGLRTDRDHLEALTSYHSLLAERPSSRGR